MKVLFLAILFLAVAAISDATAQTQTVSFTITWQDNSSGAGQETRFELERKRGPSGTFVKILDTKPDVTKVIDTITDALSQELFTYRVRAGNTAGVSGYSNEASITAPLIVVPPAAPSGLTATP